MLCHKLEVWNEVGEVKTEEKEEGKKCRERKVGLVLSHDRPSAHKNTC